MTRPLNPQTLAADPSASVFVTANAGSGKTTTLVSRVARLLLRGVNPAAVLCVTYTKAAAAEMQARLFKVLGDWSVLDDKALSRKLGTLVEVDEGHFDEDALSGARALFARALETPGGLKIQTIHAFCEKLLRRFPLEAGVSPRFTVLEDAAAAEMSARAREQVALASMRREGALAEAYRHFAVELDPGRFDELFRTIEARRSELTAYVAACADGRAFDPWALCGARTGVTPEAIEAETLGRIDWAAWTRARQALFEGSANDQKAASRMAEVRREAPAFDAVVKVFCTDAGGPRASMATKSVPLGIKDWLTEEQGRICAARDEIRAARMARDTAHVLTLAQAYGALYEAEKAARGGLDFADLVVRTCKLLTTREDAAWVLFKLDGGIEHILVDEAQDTAPDQWEILRGLTEEFFAGAGARPTESTALARTIFAVGDEKQSIYSFQGARPERLSQETAFYLDRIEAAGGTALPVPLEVSWRSTPEVLHYVDAVFAPELRARALTPGRTEPPRHIAARKLDHGSVDLWPLFKDVKPPEREAWDPLDADRGENARKKLAMRIASEIRAAVVRRDSLHDKVSGLQRAADYGDFLILVRRRDVLFEEIIRALKQTGVPVAGADRLNLSDHIVFDDLLALGRWVLFPKDDLTLAALLRSPFCDVDEDALFNLAHGRKGDLWGELRRRSGERPEWGEAAGFFLWLQGEAAIRSPFDLYGRVLNRLDANGRSLRARLFDRLGREAEEAVDEFLSQVLAAENRGVHDLEGLVAGLEKAEVTVKREMEAAVGEVRVMTVHGAKGLEAPVVFLPDTTVKAKAQGSPLFRTEAGEFLWAPRKGDDTPASADARRLRDEKADDESLRLLYVALTRARDRLVLCGRIPATRDADRGSWWTVLSDAFERPEIAAKTREVQVGELTVARYGPDPERAETRLSVVAAAAPEPAWLTVAVPAERGARWASPSTIADAARDSAPSPLSERSGLGRFRRGELIHKLFQILPDLEPAARPDAARRLLARERDLTDAQREEMVAACFGVLDDARFAAVFGPGSRAEVALAGTAPGLPAGVAISGRLDRLVVGPERVLVIDYKTNRPAPERAEDADPAYLAQMAAYVAVLRALYPDREIEAALVWTDGPRLTPVPQDVISRTLDAMRTIG